MGCPPHVFVRFSRGGRCLGALHDHSYRYTSPRLRDLNAGGWRVFIDSDNNGVFDSGELSVLTGIHSFIRPAGTHRIARPKAAQRDPSDAASSSGERLRHLRTETRPLQTSASDSEAAER